MDDEKDKHFTELSRNAWTVEVQRRRDEIKHLYEENRRFAELVSEKKTELGHLEEKAKSLRREWKDLDKLLVTRVKRLTTLEEEWLSVAEEMESGLLSRKMTRMLNAKLKAEQDVLLSEKKIETLEAGKVRSEVFMKEQLAATKALQEELEEFHEWKHARKSRGGKARVDSM